MTGKEFKKLEQDCEIYMDGKAYRVEDTNQRMGQVKLQHIVFLIDVYEYQDETYDTEDDANDAVSTSLTDLKEELEDLNEQLLECDDDYKDEIQNDIDEKERLIDELEYCDIETEESGEPFWMHYKDIVEEYC